MSSFLSVPGLEWMWIMPVQLMAQMYGNMNQMEAMPSVLNSLNIINPK